MGLFFSLLSGFEGVLIKMLRFSLVCSVIFSVVRVKENEKRENKCVWVET